MKKEISRESIGVLALKAMQTGVDEKNFKILKMLPANTKSIMKEIGLTKAPVNARLNKLRDMGLVKRHGNIILTDLGQELIQAVDKFTNMVVSKVC